MIYLIIPHCETPPKRSPCCFKCLNKLKMSHFKLFFVVIVLLVTIAAGHHNDSTDIQPRKRYYVRGNMHKYLVSIRTRDKIYNWGDNHFCSGALLTSRWVLTATGCVSTSAGPVRRRTSRRNLIVVVYTALRLRKPLDQNRIRVDNVVYSNERKICCQDMVLIKLSRHVIGTKNHVLKIPTTEISEDWLCFSLGWGRLYHVRPLTNTSHLDAIRNLYFTSRMDLFPM